jgi:hypothetical protein
VRQVLASQLEHHSYAGAVPIRVLILNELPKIEAPRNIEPEQPGAERFDPRPEFNELC